MTPGHLSQYFTGVASKRLRAVEVNPSISNQHEFNGVNGLRSILGDAEPITLDARFIYLSDEKETPHTANCKVCWYDSRRGQTHRSAEYRLYFPSSSVMELAQTNDLLVVGKRPDGSLLIIIVSAESTFENQIRWLFGIANESVRYQIQTEADTDKIKIGYTTRLILEQLGIENQETDNRFLEKIILKFGNVFPSTKDFSAFARQTVDGSAVSDPDGMVVAWMEREELLFRTLERHLLEDRLRKGFQTVDEFVEVSLSVQNRRKSRAGSALENHLEAVFLAHSLTYSREKETENRAKPDFIFPGINQYHLPNINVDFLTMLGAKLTCKDRWRQVLSEARKIRNKHLFTLEPGISESQTSEMKEFNLQLVIPYSLHSTYSLAQQGWLMTLEEFIRLVADRQSYF